MKSDQSTPSPDPSRLQRLRAWLFRRQSLRLALVALGGLATLIAIFYTVENWRGKRTWEHVKRELEAKGQVLDWNAYIPKPVPDDQNIFKAPKMSEWFVGRGSSELSKRLSPEMPRPYNLIAELIVVPPDASVAPADADLSETNEAAREQVLQLLRRVSEQNAGILQGPSLTSPQRMGTFLAASTNAIKSVRIVLRTAKKPTTVELANLCSASTAGSGRWIVWGGNVLQGSQPAYTAADYLARSDQFEGDFNVIREALKRPYALMPGDYRLPFAMPIPNFVTVRATVQTLASRAQCHLLLNQPDEALRDLTLIHDVSGLMEARPTGKPMTLVAAMINVAVAGLYVNTIEDGFRLHAWREPQLLALQKQLQEINLAGPVKEAFQTEPAAACQTIENSKGDDLRKLFFSDKKPWFKKVIDPLYLFFTIGPRGWRYQNIATIARVQQPTIEVIDLEHNLIHPRKAVEAQTAVSQIMRPSPYTFLAAMYVPNFSRAMTTLAHNQTMVHEGIVACALERYRIAHGDYPQTLDALVPAYLDKVPVELIDGQPFKYHRTNAGQFTLYSIGWNEKDDGGSPSPEDKNGNAKNEQGDWVWDAAE